MLEAKDKSSPINASNLFAPVEDSQLPLQEEGSAPRASEVEFDGQEPLQEGSRSAEAADLFDNGYAYPSWDELGISLPINSNHNSPLAVSEEEELNAEATDSEDDGVDAMGVVSYLPSPNCGRKRRPSNYLGPSSTKGLLDKAQTAINRARHISHSDTSSASLTGTNEQDGSRATAVPSLSAHIDGGIFGMIIPSRPEADSLVESYWTWTHSLYPFIHRPSFEERYKAIWFPRVQTGHDYHASIPMTKRNFYADTSDRLFYTMLNMVFALGAHFSPNIDQQSRASASHTFYERGKKLIDIDLLANGELALVQTLLLTGQYLQSTDMSNSCWNIVGLAVRVGQRIGLHHDPENCDQECCSSHPFDQLDLEMRRRSWAGCVMLDRYVFLIFT